MLPIYRPRLEAEELAAVDRAFAILRHGDWYLIAPQSLDTSFYEQRYGKPIVRFPDACLYSVRSYSRLLLTDEFYAAFAQYEYMLITQDDVYVLRDDLPYWLSRRFDYIGAPWPDGHEVELSMSPRPGIHGHALRAYVGNGGFSLRRIAACRQLLAEFPEEAAWFSENGRAEDMFFACVRPAFATVCPPQSASGRRFCLGGVIAAHACPVSGAVADGDPRLSQIRP